MTHLALLPSPLLGPAAWSRVAVLLRERGLRVTQVGLPERITSVDWGLHNQIWALGSSRTRAVARDRWFQFRWLGDLSGQERNDLLRDFEGVRGLAITYGPGGDGFNNFGTKPNFLKWCAALGIVPKLERVFTSPAGTVIYEVYSVDGSRTSTSRRTSSLNQ